MIQDKINSPIFITGCERSGSTIIARIVSHCGAFTGRTTEMMENIEIKKLIDTYYELIDADKKGQNPLPNTEKLIIPTNWKQKIEDVLSDEKYENTTWMLKGSRLCQAWPVWHYAFPNAKWIIIRRRTGDIIDSCLKTGYMTAYKNKEGWLGWIHEHEKLFVEMIEAGVNCKQVWPERMATGDYQQMKETIDWLRLTWNDDVLDIIKPLMWNSRQRTK
jgi:hypothetical protein